MQGKKKKCIHAFSYSFFQASQQIYSAHGIGQLTTDSGRHSEMQIVHVGML